MLSQIFREQFGTIEQQAQRTFEEAHLSEKAKAYIENIKKPKVFEMPNFSQVKAKFWEVYRNEVCRNDKGPIIDAHTALILKNVCLYVVKDESCPYDANKGLIFLGGVGTGKTAVMKAMQKTIAFFDLPTKFAMSNVPLIFKNLQADKDFEISDYFKSNRCLDDVGFSEPTLLIYGQLTRPIDQILSIRYDKFINEGQITHMTTNLSLENLDKHFDERIIDRLKEMCTIVSFKGESFRGR